MKTPNMNDDKSRLEREVQELRAEVRRLRRLIEGIVIVLGLAAMLIFPQIAIWPLGVACLSFFAFLVSPVRSMIFSSIFRKRDEDERGA